MGVGVRWGGGLGSYKGQGGDIISLTCAAANEDDPHHEKNQDGLKAMNKTYKLVLFKVKKCSAQTSESVSCGGGG